jgi:hypothetical protein
MPHGQHQGTCVHRSIPRKYAIFLLLAMTLSVWVLAVPPHNSYAIKSVIDQAQDQGYTDGMVRELTRLFPDSRALLRARELSVPPAALATQALSDHDRRALEERVYNGIIDRLGAEGMDVATLLVSYVGQMRFKVVAAVRTKELPYPQIRQTLTRMRDLIENDVLRASFRGFEMAELSSFTVLNRRNGRYYEYPVLYQNLALPYFDGEEENGPTVRERPHPALPGELPPGASHRPRFPWGDRPWEQRERRQQAREQEQEKERDDRTGSTTRTPEAEGTARRTVPARGPGEVAPRRLPHGSYTSEDFYGAPPAPQHRGGGGDGSLRDPSSTPR